MSRRNLILLGISLAAVFALFFYLRPKPKPEKEEKSKPQEVALVEMGLEAQKHVGLEVAPAKVEELREFLEVTGTVQPIDSQIVHIRPLASGRLRAVLAKVGDRVTAGQPLAQLDAIEVGDLSSQYLAAQADLKKLQAQHATALKQLERNRQLVKIEAASQKDLEGSEAEEQALQASIEAQQSVIRGLSARMHRLGVDGENAPSSSVTAIRSGFAGVVIKAAAAPGEVVDSTSELFQIADLSRVWVQAEVYEKDLGRIRSGQTAAISVDTYPDEKFSGRVTYVGDILDPQTRTVKVRCEVANPGTKLKLDMFATVNLPTTFSKRALVVPASAIQEVEGKNVVFVQKAPTKFEPRNISLGKVLGGKAEVLTGLREGEPVVANGAFHLKSILLGGTFGEQE